MKREKIVQLICSLLILVFIYAAFSKLLILAGFANQLRNQPLPHWLTRQLVWVLPAVELTTAALLFFPQTRKAGLFSALILMTLFTMYIALILSGAYGRIPCSCGGILNHLSWKSHLLFNVVVLLMTILGIILNRRPLGPAHLSRKPGSSKG